MDGITSERTAPASVASFAHSHGDAGFALQDLMPALRCRSVAVRPAQRGRTRKGIDTVMSELAEPIVVEATSAPAVQARRPEELPLTEDMLRSLREAGL